MPFTRQHSAIEEHDYVDHLHATPNLIIIFFFARALYIQHHNIIIIMGKKYARSGRLCTQLYTSNLDTNNNSRKYINSFFFKPTVEHLLVFILQIEIDDNCNLFQHPPPAQPIPNDLSAKCGQSKVIHKFVCNIMYLFISAGININYNH